jgi:hypothetical protein
VKSRLLLDVIVWKGSAIFELLACEDQSLLVGRDTFLILDFSFNIFYGVWGFNIKSDGLASQSLNKDLHTTSKSQDEMECWLFLDVVVT